MKSKAFEKDNEPTFEKNLIESINQHKGENKNRNDMLNFLRQKTKFIKIVSLVKKN